MTTSADYLIPKCEAKNKAEELAEAHWKYVSGVIYYAKAAGDEAEIEEIKYHYITAFIHGYKHGVEERK